jgi:hypothetical protein
VGFATMSAATVAFDDSNQRQGIANGERMLGIPTPNFCDASSEFDGSTTTGHPND